MAEGVTSPILDRLVEKAGRLYTLPAVAVQVLELTSRPEVDVAQLKRCIENDPALAGRVLRVVNSSLFGLSREVSDLGQALALLGTTPLKLLVLGFSLPDNLFVGMAGDILRRYWRRTLTKAVAAREISQSLWKLPGDEAFIAGLLQDVGMLVLMQQLGEPYVRFLDRAFSKAPDVAELERKSLGFSHAQLSARLLARWCLPPTLVEAIAAGSSPRAELPVTTRSLVQILHLSELLASLLTENRSDLLADLLDTAVRYHNLTHTQLSELVNMLQEKVEQLADVLNLELPDGADYRSILLEAHGRLSEVAAEAAVELLRGQQSNDLDTDSEELLAEVQSLASAASEVARPLDGEIAAASSAMYGNEVAPIATGGEPETSVARTVAHGPSAARPYAAFAAPACEGDPGLLGVLTTVGASCRQARCSLSLLLVGIDRFDELVMTRGVPGAKRIVALLATLCRGVSSPETICRQTRDDRFAVIVPGSDRQAAVDLGHQLLREIRQIGAPLPNDVRPTISVSVGLAAVSVPPKNFQPEELIDSATRCLHAAQTSGGNALKSIEIY